MKRTPAQNTESETRKIKHARNSAINNKKEQVPLGYILGCDVILKIHKLLGYNMRMISLVCQQYYNKDLIIKYQTGRLPINEDIFFFEEHPGR